MSHISLVCSIHEELGLASVSELLAILERIRPKVIFLEVPPAAFDDFYKNCSRHNLESRVVRQYRDSHPVELIPVDLPTPEREFFEEHTQMSMRIASASSDYRQLLSQDRAYVGTYGFRYLNSDYCSKLWSDIYAEMLCTLTRLGDVRFLDIFASWIDTNDRRENAMLDSILNFCSEHSIGRGVLLLGAAHRQHIIDKLRERSEIESANMQWEFTID